MIDPTLVQEPVKVLVKEMFSNGNYAKTIGVVELPIRTESAVWEVHKESLQWGGVKGGETR